MDVNMESPAGDARRAWTVDANDVARRLGCTRNELFLQLSGPRTLFAERANALASSAMPVNSARWHSTMAYMPRPVRARVTTALISTVSRSAALGKDGLPRQLLRIGFYPLLVQSLRQLADAGITRVVVVVGGPVGMLIKRTLEKSAVARYVQLDVVDLGPNYTGCHAQSLLHAHSALLGEGDGEGTHGEAESQVLLSTSDHIFESALVHRLIATALPAGCVGRVLVEPDARRALGALAPTCVRVACEGEEGWRGGRASEPQPRRVLEIGRAVDASHPLEAGLFVLQTKALFDALLRRHAESPPFALALCDALSELARKGGLVAVPTSGMRWCSVETAEQLVAARRIALSTQELAAVDAEAGLSPQRYAALPRRATEHALAAVAGPVGMAGQTNGVATGEPLLRRVASESLVSTPRGQLTDVSGWAGEAAQEGWRPYGDTADGAEAAAEALNSAAPREPLIPAVRSHWALPSLPSGIETVTISSSTGVGAEGTPLHLLPVALARAPIHATPSAPSPASPLRLSAATASSAYARLHDTPPSPEPTPGTLTFEWQPALGRELAGEGQPAGATIDVDVHDAAAADAAGHSPGVAADVQLKTAALPDGTPPDGLHVTLTMERRVPLVGYAVLLFSLLTSSATGLAFDALGTRASPALKMCWRFCGTALVLAPYAALRAGTSARLRTALRSRRTLACLLGAGAAWWLHCYPYAVALQHTSVANALLFSSLAPIILLGVRLARGLGASALEIGGALIAVLGTALLAIGAPGAAPQGQAPAVLGNAPLALTLGGGGADIAGGGAAEAAGAAGGIDLWPRSDSVREPVANVIAFVGSAGGAAYMLLCKELRPVVDPPVLFPLLNGIAWLIALPAVSVGAGGAPLDRSPTGVFGWARAEHAWAMLFACALVDTLGNLGFVVSLKYLPPLTISVIVLLQPLFAAAYDVLLMGEALPSWAEAAGMLMTLTGAMAVVTGSATSASSVEVDLGH